MPTTYQVTSTPTTIAVAGLTSAEVTNTGSDDVFLSPGKHRLRPGQSRIISPTESALTVTGSGSVSVATGAAVTSFQQRIAADSALKATYASRNMARLLGALAVDQTQYAITPLMDQALAPTIAYSAAGAGSSITNGVETLIVGGPFTPEAGSAYNIAYSGQAGYLGPSGPPGPEVTPMWLPFETDAADFEITYLGSASPQHRLIINGEARHATYQSATGGSGQQHRLRVTFAAGRKWRRFVLESASMGVKSIVVGPTDTIQPPGTSRPPLAIMGDSYTVNNGGELGLTCCRALGLTPMLNGSGGTGYLNASTGGKQVFGDRLATVLALSPAALVVYGGINDGTTGLQAAVSALITAARAISPSLPIVIVGSQGPPSAAGSAATKSALLKAAAAASGAAYVDPVTGHIYAASGAQVLTGTPWITGTGKSGSPANDGNADIWIDTDGTHPLASSTPTVSGYVYHGLRLAAALRVALPVAI